MTTTNEELGVGTPSVSSSNATQSSDSHTPMFAALMREAELYPEPTPEEIAEADRIFSMLMGDEVAPRREFIEENATYANIDA